MMRFNLLCDLKEVHLMRTQDIYLPQQQQGSPHLSSNRPLSLTEFFDQLTPKLSHAMGMLASRGLSMFPQHGMLVSRDYFS